MTKPRVIRTSTEHTIEVPRTARFYVHGEDAEPGQELWIVLHGLGQLAGNFVEYFSTLDDGTRYIVAPEALNRAYTLPPDVPAADRPVGATWMTREFRDAEMRDYIRYLDLVHVEVARRFRPSRTVLVGFSQGGATAMRWVARGSATVDHVVLWGATLPPDFELASARETLRGATLTLVIGKTDQYISPEAAAAERSRLDAAGVQYDFVEYEGGHSIKRPVLSQVIQRLTRR